MARNLLALGLLTALSAAACSTAMAQSRTTIAAATPRPVMLDSVRPDSPHRDSSVTRLARTDSAHADLTHADSVHADSARKAREIDVSREAFAYGGGGRDPFMSLMNADKSGPEFGELQLVGVYQNLEAQSRSVVVLREKIGGKRHKLVVGDRLGRLQLVQIRPKDAVFVIQDFGIERRETLSLRKQEDATP